MPLIFFFSQGVNVFGEGLLVSDSTVSFLCSSGMLLLLGSMTVFSELLLWVTGDSVMMGSGFAGCVDVRVFS